MAWDKYICQSVAGILLLCHRPGFEYSSFAVFSANIWLLDSFEFEFAFFSILRNSNSKALICGAILQIRWLCQPDICMIIKPLRALEHSKISVPARPFNKNWVVSWKKCQISYRDTERSSRDDTTKMLTRFPKDHDLLSLYTTKATSSKASISGSNKAIKNHWMNEQSNGFIIMGGSYWIMWQFLDCVVCWALTSELTCIQTGDSTGSTLHSHWINEWMLYHYPL